MKAFVKVNKGTFPNVNFYMAWEAFNTLGYSVTCFEEGDLDFLDITPQTPLFAGVTVFKKVMDKLGVRYPVFNCYPESLTPYYGREVSRSTLGEVRKKFQQDNVPIFVKPIKTKVFTGTVLRNILNLIPITNVPDDTEVYTSTPICIKSEYRVYVNDGEIKGVKHYYGDWSLAPRRDVIRAFVDAYRNPPVAYGLDVGIVFDHETQSHKEVILEVNDGCNLGNYGLDSIQYGEMILARWFEIMAANTVEDRYQADLKQQEHYDEVLGKDKSMPYRVEDWYDKPFSENRPDITGRSCRVKDESDSIKAKVFKGYAAEILKSIREEEQGISGE